MKPSKLTLTAAKEFGQDILNGNIFRDESLLIKLYNTFFNKRIDEIYDFVEFIGRFLNDSQIYQLVEKLLAHEGANVGKGTLREYKTLGKYLFLYEIKKSAEAHLIFQNIITILNESNIDPEKLLRSITFPPVVYQHYKSLILPLSLRVNANETNPDDAHFQYVTDSVLFHVLNTIIMEKLKTLNNPLKEGMIIIALKEITALENAKKNYNGINGLSVRQNIFANMNQCILPTIQLQNSNASTIEKFKVIPELLLILNDAMIEVKYNETIAKHLDTLLQAQEFTKLKAIINAFSNLKLLMSESEYKTTVTDHFDALMQYKDEALLMFALKKLEPVPLLTRLANISIFGTTDDVDIDMPIGVPKQFQPCTVDLSKVNDNDSIENIRIRFQKLVMSIKEIMNVPVDAKPQIQESSADGKQQNNVMLVLQSSIAKLSQFSHQQWSTLPPRTIASLTTELKTKLSEQQLILSTNLNSKDAYDRVKFCLDNIIAFENSCKQHEQQTLITVGNPVAGPAPSDAENQHPLLPPADEKDKAETPNAKMGK